MKGIAGAAKIHQVATDFKSFDSALEMYKLNAGSYPTTQQGLKALVEQPATSPAPNRWAQVLSKIPLDPWHNAYVYRLPGKKRPGEFEIISKGPDGLENTADDLSSQDE
ncbi:MAG: type II secretion system major pseudopilin GspG [Verrucomicrobia bacterium]|nr:type II secretion system major pseudopilin GspG [Verrucomicrobiota bacterium]